MASFGLPGILIIPAIALEIIGPILIVIGYKTKIAAAALSLFCFATAIIFHNDFADQVQLTAFLKNIALAGGFLFLVVNGSKGYGLDKKYHLSNVLEKNLNKKGLKVKVINASVSGDTSAGGLNRIDWTISEKNIDIILLCLGSNDMLRGISPYETKTKLNKIKIIDILVNNAGTNIPEPFEKIKQKSKKNKEQSHKKHTKNQRERNKKKNRTKNKNQK